MSANQLPAKIQLSPVLIGTLLWSLIPSLAIWVGLYEIKSAAWTYALYHGIFLLPGAIVGRNLWVPTLTRPKLKHVAMIFSIATIFSAFTVIAYERAGQLVLRDEDVGRLLSELDLTRANLVFFGLYAIIVNPLFEEIYWRGVLFNALEKVPIKHFALVWSSVTHALFHYLIFRLVLFPIWNEIGILTLAIYNGILALIYRRTGSLITTAIAHGLLSDMACICLIVDFFRKNPPL